VCRGPVLQGPRLFLAHGDKLVSSRLRYVSDSRGRFDAQIYTNDAQKLGEELSRDVSKQSALETEHEMGGRDNLLSVRRISDTIHLCTTPPRRCPQAGSKKL